VRNVADVTAALREAEAGTSVAITVMRDRQAMTLEATVPEREEPFERRRPARSEIAI
jgi:S1-C subfamily serine protease